MKILAVICAAIFGMATQPALACTIIDPAYARRYADIIFVGSPRKLTTLVVDRKPISAKDRTQKISEIYFQVIQMLRGPSLPAATITVTGSIRGYCSGLRDMMELNPSLSGYYLIYAWKDKISGNYLANAHVPNGPIMPQIDPRFPSGSWALRSNTRGLAWYWLRMQGSQFHQRIRPYVRNQIGITMVR